MKYKILAAFICLLAVFVVLTGLSKTSFAKGNPRYASIVMDADTGLILSQSYANKSLHPASLTKAMTLFMVFEAMERGELKSKDRIRISKHATTMIPSKLNLPVGSTIRVEDAIYALVTKSANDVAAAVAEHLGGTERNFAKMMTERAHGMGMTRTTFRNASGLHDKRQVSTARDMARLAQVTINEYPEYYKYYSRRNFTYQGNTYHNHNRLMQSYKGMDGMKTGYIQASGFNLVGSAVRNNRRIIGVVFGGRTSKTRNRHMAQLLDRGFAKLNTMRVASAKVPLPPRKPGILTAMASLNKLKPSSGNGQDGTQAKWALLNPSLQSGLFRRLIGEGDYDPAVSKRIETGLIAIAAHKGEPIPAKYLQPAAANFKNDIKKAAFTPRANQPWGIQVGAFASRAKTDRAIMKTLKALPGELAGASPIIAPLSTNNGWLFRGRLSGYTRQEAFRACSYVKDCLPVPPANR